MDAVPHWVNNKRYPGTSGRNAPVYDPATGAVMREVPLGGVDDVDAAVQAAVEAFPRWRDTSVGRRQQTMFRLRDLVIEHDDEIAALITAEHGKTLSDARGEVQRGLEVIELATSVAHLMKGDFSENVSTDVDTYSIRQPLGVSVGITPFNFPAMVPMWMFPLAIACGNTFVLKPSEKDPSASMFVAELFAEAGLPDGVFNIVHGDRLAVQRLLEHPDVATVSFVGSTPIARFIYQTASAAGKRVQALGGAKNHAIVMADADLDSAADALVSAAYGSAGERCMAVSTIVAVGDVGDALVDGVRARVDDLRVGPGSTDGIDMGPLVTGEHRDKVAAYIESGVNEGADLVIDGRGLKVEGHEHGFYLGPSMFDNVATNMRIYREEIFGPVLVQLRVDTLADAIDLINANPYGNGTAIFTNNGAAARAFQNRIEVGLVGINVPIPVPVAYHSFGGWKQSLFGDLHLYGEDGVRFYTRGKVVTSRWIKRAAGVDLGFPSGDSGD